MLHDIWEKIMEGKKIRFIILIAILPIVSFFVLAKRFTFNGEMNIWINLIFVITLNVVFFGLIFIYYLISKRNK